MRYFLGLLFYILLVSPTGAQKLGREKVDFMYVRLPLNPVVPGERRVKFVITPNELEPREVIGDYSDIEYRYNAVGADSAQFIERLKIAGIKNDPSNPQFIVHLMPHGPIVIGFTKTVEHYNSKTKVKTTDYAVFMEIQYEFDVLVYDTIGNRVWSTTVKEVESIYKYGFTTSQKALSYALTSHSFKSSLIEKEKEALVKCQNKINKDLNDQYGYLGLPMNLTLLVFKDKENVTIPLHREALFYSMGGLDKLTRQPRDSKQWLDTAVILWEQSLHQYKLKSQVLPDKYIGSAPETEQNLLGTHKPTLSLKAYLEIKSNIFWCLLFANRFEEAERTLNEIELLDLKKTMRLTKMKEFSNQYKSAYMANYPK
jgi:hypothetical protein